MSVSNPIGNAEFQKLLTDGIIAELAVMDTMNESIDPSHLNIQSMAWDTTDEVEDGAPYDLLGVRWDMSPEGMLENEVVFTTEVKQANNDGRYTDWNTGKMTFFAECIQTGTNGYPEYLVYPPTLMVYYNKPGHAVYFYDGLKFAEAVKDRFHSRFTIARGTAEGIKFDCESKAFGFIGKARCPNRVADLQKKYAQRITERLNTPKKNTKVHKQCTGLEDLV